MCNEIAVFHRLMYAQFWYSVCEYHELVPILHALQSSASYARNYNYKLTIINVLKKFSFSCNRRGSCGCNDSSYSATCNDDSNYYYYYHNTSNNYTCCSCDDNHSYNNNTNDNHYSNNNTNHPNDKHYSNNNHLNNYH